MSDVRGAAAKGSRSRRPQRNHRRHRPDSGPSRGSRRPGNTVVAFRPGDAADTTPETLQLMLDVNLGPALWLSQAVAPHMRRQGSGAIVHVTARPGLEPASGMAAYGAGKAALAHLARSLDLELRPHWIRVNTVAPQRIGTPSNRASLPADVMARAMAPRGHRGGDCLPGQRGRGARERGDSPGLRRLTAGFVLGGAESP